MRVGLRALVVALVLTQGAVAASGAAIDHHASGAYYIALGDSYSSGEGLVPYLTADSGCNRSSQSYPEIVRAELDFSRFRFLACSGATTAQVNAQVAALSPVVLRDAALTTLTAGGDDLPFAGLIAACLGAGLAGSPEIHFVAGVGGVAQCDSAITAAAALLGASFDPASGSVTLPSSALQVPLSTPSTLQVRLGVLYDRIIRAEDIVKSSKTGPKIIVLQYPTLLSDNGPGNCLAGSQTINFPSNPLYNGLHPVFSSLSTTALVALNSDLQQETAVVVATLRHEGYLGVSIATPHDFVPLDCQTGVSADLTGLLGAADSTSVAPGSFHPTAAGQLVFAQTAVSAWINAVR